MMLKEDAYCICKLYMHRPVQLHTKSGQIHQGTIVHVDSDYVYLQPLSAPVTPDARGFYPYPFYNPAASTITTLALFDLLAITLLLL